MPDALSRPRPGRYLVLISLLLCGMGNLLHGTAQIEIVAATHTLPGRLDRLAPGATVLLRAPAPAGGGVTWYRDDTVIATTTVNELELTALAPGDTGNYQARWSGAAAGETALLPLTVGPLPASHFAAPESRVGQPIFPTELNLERVLDDGRVLGRSSSWGGTGQYHTYFAALPGPDQPRTTLFNYNWTTGSFLGALGDGSFYISKAPFRYGADATPAAFTLPSVFAENAPFGFVDRGAHGILLRNSEHLVGSSRDGTVHFIRTPAQLGGAYISSAVALRDGRIGIHLEFASTDGAQAAGQTLRLTANGNIDPTFRRIGNPSSTASPLELADGTWARIQADGLSTWTSEGDFVARRPLPVNGLHTNLSLAPNGDLYGMLPGLGIVRYRASDFALDGDFFLPVHHAEGWLPTAPLVTDSNRVFVVASLGDSGSMHLAEVLSARDHALAAPVVGREIMVYREGPYDLAPRFYHPFAPRGLYGPRAGEPQRLLCPVFGDSLTSVQWIALDGTAEIVTQPDGTGFIPSFSTAYAGRYQLVATNHAGRALGPVLDLRPLYQPRLTNLSGRARVTTPDDRAIAGFVLDRRSGATAEAAAESRLLLRGIGPTLTDFEVASPLPDPRLELHRLNGPRLAQNDDWIHESGLSNSVFERVGAFAPLTTSKDAMLYRSLEDGAFTVHTLPKPGESGIALTEIYLDDTELTTRNELANLSLRGWAGNDDDVLVAGFVIEDPDHLDRPLRLLVRGVGPALADYGIDAPLADPILRIFNAAGEEIALNDNWSVSAEDTEALAATAQTVGAFDLAADSLDAALLIELPAGAYTAHVQPQATAPGVALLEIYVVD